MTNNNTFTINTTISDLTKSDIVDFIVVSVKYNKWIPEMDDITIFNSSISLMLPIIGNIKSMQAPYNRIQYSNYVWGLGRKVIKATGSLGRHYAWARQETEDPGYYRETRIYLSKDNKPVFTSKIMDGFDEFINDYFNKAAE